MKINKVCAMRKVRFDAKKKMARKLANGDIHVSPQGNITGVFNASPQMSQRDKASNSCIVSSKPVMFATRTCV